MRAKRALLCAAMAPFLAMSGMDGLGSLTTARAAHPAVFIPGNVLEYTVAGVDGYVFNGQTKRLFKDPLAQTDSELYREAQLVAKRNLLAYFREKKGVESFTMSGAQTLYRFAEDRVYTVVMFVPKAGVTLGASGETPLPPAQAPAPTPAPPPAMPEMPDVPRLQTPQLQTPQPQIPDWARELMNRPPPVR